MNYLIYSIEDDLNISKIINLTLKNAGYNIVSFNNGVSFLETFKNKKPNMILLDLMLPDIDGFNLLKKIRDNKENDDIEIIIVSAKGQLLDKVDGFNLGADDYIEKPFEVLELISRVNAKVRRFNNSSVLKEGNIEIDKENHICKVKGITLKLTNIEFTILYLLLENKGKVVSRDQIFKIIWGDQAFESRTIDVHINSLRTKLKEEGKHIISIYGIGYQYQNE